MGKHFIHTSGYGLLKSFWEYDPLKRISASDALKHSFFSEEPKMNV